MLNIALDTSPLANAHAGRGVGAYTRFLSQELEKIPDLAIYKINTVRRLFFQPDIIHYPFFDPFFLTLPYRRPAPTLVTIHDLIPLIFPDKFPAGWRGGFKWWWQRWKVQGVEGVVTDSHASKSDIINYLRIPESRVFVTYLAPNPALHKATPLEIKKVRTHYRLPATYLLYVGDINYNKNIPQLIKMMKFLPNSVHLVCVGRQFKEQTIPEWQWIETQMALSNVASRVHFLSTVDDPAELSALYSGATIYVQPSLYEGFGLPVLEAMHCHTPVISARTSSLTEVGGSYVEYAEPRAESLAEAVKGVLEWGPSQRQRVIKQGFQWSEQFTWQKTAEETATIYRQLT